MLAANNGHTDMVSILLQLGADVNIKSNVSYMLDNITIVIMSETILKLYNFYFN